MYYSFLKSERSGKDQAKYIEDVKRMVARNWKAEVLGPSRFRDGPSIVVDLSKNDHQEHRL